VSAKNGAIPSDNAQVSLFSSYHSLFSTSLTFLDLGDYPVIATPGSWILPADRKNSQFVPPLLIFFDLYILRHHLAPYLNHTPSLPKNGDPAPPPPPPSSSHHPQPIRFDLERAIDDFIVLVTMLGNDFLPSLPLPDFEIYLGAIDRIVDIWKITIRYTGSYLTKDGIIRVARLRELFKGLSDLEPWSDKQERE
jgi:hypothetical protein